MELANELKQLKNNGKQKRAGFRMNKKVDDCRIAGHVQACVISELAYRKDNDWTLWVDVHEVAKACAKHAHEASSLYGEYFESGRITRGEAEIRQLHDLARQLRVEGFTFQYGLKPTKDGKKHLAIIVHKHAMRVPWGSAPRITRGYWKNEKA